MSMSSVSSVSSCLVRLVCLAMLAQRQAALGHSMLCSIELLVFYACLTQVKCKHEMLNQCWFNVGPASKTMAQH